MCELPKSILVEHIYGQSEPPCRIKLMKVSKGWQWELSCSGDDFPTILKNIEEINKAMKIKFGAVDNV